MSDIVYTASVKKFLKSVGKLELRDTPEACLMVVDGEPGLGKTRIAEWWGFENDAIFLRAKAEWTPNWMLEEILEAVSFRAGVPIKRAHTKKKKFQTIVELLNSIADKLEREDNMLKKERQKSLAIIIDEVDHIARRGGLMEVLRDITDYTFVSCILVGMGRVRPALTKFPQIQSRVSQVVEFDRLTLKDAALLVKHFCPFSLSAGLVDFLHKESGGYVRELRRATDTINLWAKRKNPSHDITPEDLSGKTLFSTKRTVRGLVNGSAL